jgi:hypothetical protein
MGAKSTGHAGEIGNAVQLLCRAFLDVRKAA